MHNPRHLLALLRTVFDITPSNLVRISLECNMQSWSEYSTLFKFARRSEPYRAIDDNAFLIDYVDNRAHLVDIRAVPKQNNLTGLSIKKEITQLFCTNGQISSSCKRPTVLHVLHFFRWYSRKQSLESCYLIFRQAQKRKCLQSELLGMEKMKWAINENLSVCFFPHKNGWILKKENTHTDCTLSCSFLVQG